MGETPVPRWAAYARTVFRLLVALWGLSLMVRFVAAASNLVLGTRFFHGDAPGWLVVAAYVLTAVALASGAGWLVGAAILGYQEPRSRQD